MESQRTHYTCRSRDRRTTAKVSQQFEPLPCLEDSSRSDWPHISTESDEAKTNVLAQTGRAVLSFPACPGNQDCHQRGIFDVGRAGRCQFPRLGELV